MNSKAKFNARPINHSPMSWVQHERDGKVMTIAFARADSAPAHPLDLVEQIVSEQDWPIQRHGADELTTVVGGSSDEYHLWFSWREDLGALQFSCAFGMRLPPPRLPALHSLLALLNAKVPIGHFDVWHDDGVICFRYALLVRGGSGISSSQIEDLIEIGIGECERSYPAFQFVVWGGKSPEESIAAALMETVGEA